MKNSPRWRRVLVAGALLAFARKSGAVTPGAAGIHGARDVVLGHEDIVADAHRVFELERVTRDLQLADLAEVFPVRHSLRVAVGDVPPGTEDMDVEAVAGLLDHPLLGAGGLVAEAGVRVEGGVAGLAGELERAFDRVLREGGTSDEKREDERNEAHEGLLVGGTFNVYYTTLIIKCQYS